MNSITLHDVARLAEVSIKTVSRVLNNEPHVSEHKRKRVLAAVEELNYRPNIAARTLSSAKSYLLGFLAPGVGANVYVDQLLRGVLAACQKSGYHLIVEFYDVGNDDLVAKTKALCSSTPLDGAVLAPGICDTPGVLAFLHKRGIPHVAISPNQQIDSSHVYIDELSATYEMTRYLLQSGHKRIAFIGHEPRLIFTRRRLQGFLQAMKEASIKVPERYIVASQPTFRSGQEGAKKLLASNSRPTAIVAVNDETAFGAIVAAYQQGLSVPRDLSIAGFDDNLFATMSWPQLTTIRQPLQAMAITAAELLLHPRKNAPSTQAIMLPFELIIRDTTAAPPPDGTLKNKTEGKHALKKR